MFEMTDFIAGAVMIFISLILRKHIYTEIGDNGVSIPAVRVSMVKWMYAQAIWHEILLRTGMDFR